MVTVLLLCVFALVMVAAAGVAGSTHCQVNSQELRRMDGVRSRRWYVLTVAMLAGSVFLVWLAADIANRLGDVERWSFVGLGMFIAGMCVVANWRWRSRLRVGWWAAVLVLILAASIALAPYLTTVLPFTIHISPHIEI